MQCPKCGGRGYCYATKPSGTVKQRYRQCRICGHRFSTWEEIEGRTLRKYEKNRWMRIYSLNLKIKQKVTPMAKRARRPATGLHAGVGHNGGPDMEAERLFELIGPRKTEVAMPFQCRAPWTAYATEDELKRLAKLQARIWLREQALKDLRTEVRRIMKRNIQRMSRAKDKN